MNDWDAPARLLWALAMASLATAAVYGLQSMVFPTPPAPWLGPIGFALLLAHFAYQWSRKRDRDGAGR